MPPDAVRHARSAGLRYVRDEEPGIRRVRRGKGFAYLGPDGAPVADAATLARIRRLAVPPAWQDVWICPREDGHLQATGRDARGRKQYRYHPDWRAVRDGTKFDRMTDFARALPGLRARIERDLRRPGLPREKVLAAVVRLLERTLFRVGNPEYARSNGSRGLTTLLDEHVEIAGGAVRFEFVGKAGKPHEVSLRDARLARIVRDCKEIPGEKLFQYYDDEGERREVTSGDVNDYLREATGEDFTAKDFRTWAGTVLAAMLLAERGAPASKAEAKRTVVAVVKEVAACLGNTPAVCRRSYIHPGVFEAYEAGALPEDFAEALARAAVARPALQLPEAGLVAVLEDSSA